METQDDVVSQLLDDHRRAESLYHQCSAGEDVDTQKEALDDLVNELTLHAEIEEQLVYPAMRTTLPDGDQIVDHALEEHQDVKAKLAKLKGSDPSDDEVASDIRDMMALVNGHVTEEEQLLAEFKDMYGPIALSELTEESKKLRDAKS